MRETGERHSEAVFCRRKTVALRLDLSVDTFDDWVRDGFLPRHAVERGQIRLWHWPSVEAALLSRSSEEEDNPYRAAVLRAKGHSRAVA